VRPTDPQTLTIAYLRSQREPHGLVILEHPRRDHTDVIVETKHGRHTERLELVDAAGDVWDDAPIEEPL